MRQSYIAMRQCGGKVLYNAIAAQYGAGSGNGHVQGICPKGWHLPSHVEWQQLIDYVSAHPGLWEASGTVSRSLTSQHWPSSEETSAFNQSGFSSLPTGYFISYGRHIEIPELRWTKQENAYYWSSDHNDSFPFTVTPNDSPWTTPQWEWFGSDSLEVQSYVLLLNPEQGSPEISSLPDIHYCAIRCVKD